MINIVAMDTIPAEYLTPPLALVALMGCENLHPHIMEHLKTAKPPINCLGVADPQMCERLFKPKKEAHDALVHNSGIHKA